MVSTSIRSPLKPGITIPFFLLGSSLHPSFHPKFLVQNTGNEPSETTSLLHDADEGEPLDADALERLMSSDNREDGNLTDSQREALLGDGSGLKDWGRGKVNVYNEGSNLIICDEQGEFRVWTSLSLQGTFRLEGYMGRKGRQIFQAMHKYTSACRV